MRRLGGRRLTDESGYTLIELLVAMVLGLITVTVIMSVVTASEGAAMRVTDRVDASQRGRTALEQMAQQLRSQVCLSPTAPPIVAAEPTRLRFYADMRGSAPFVPELRELAWHADGRITETRWAGSGAAPATTFTTAPTTRAIATDTETVAPGEPVFRYYAFAGSDASGATLELPAPLSEADRRRVVRVDIRFRVHPTRAGGYDRSAVVMQTQVYSRTADPTDPTRGPACL